MDKRDQGYSPVFQVNGVEEDKLQISDDIHNPNDVMYPAFQKALVTLKRIMSASHAWRNNDAVHSGSPFGGYKDAPDDMAFYGYSSNIIAFCAGRGQGKTSAMLSFTRAMSHHNHGYLKSSTGLGMETGAFSEDRFYILPPIDLTTLKEDDSLMEAVLSYLFIRLERIWNKQSSGYDRSPIFSETNKTRLLLSFRNCLNSARILKSGSHSADEASDMMDTMYQLGDSFNLKNDFYSLLQDFFPLIWPDAANKYLVIQLDDADL